MTKPEMKNVRKYANCSGGHMIIRAAVEADIPKIIKVIEDSYSPFKANICDGNIPKYAYDEIKNMLDDSRYDLWVADYNGEVIGTAAGLFFEPNTYHLKLLFVSGLHQHQGVGDRLLTHFEEEGVRRSCDLFTTNFLSWATWSDLFYKKHGYKDYETGDEELNAELKEQVRWRNEIGLLNNKDKQFVWKVNGNKLE